MTLPSESRSIICARSAGTRLATVVQVPVGTTRSSSDSTWSNVFRLEVGRQDDLSLASRFLRRDDMGRLTCTCTTNTHARPPTVREQRDVQMDGQMFGTGRTRTETVDPILLCPFRPRGP